MNPIISPFSLGKDISYDVLSWNLHGTEPMSRPQSEAQAGALTWDPFHATGRLQITHNPPYMGASGMSPRLSQYVKDNYPDSKSDLFAVFIERCGHMVCESGYFSMITQYVWMYKTVYKEFRKETLSKQIINMAHLGPGAFNEISGEVVNTVTFTMACKRIPNYISIFSRLLEYSDEESKRKGFLLKRDLFNTKQDRFEFVSEFIYAYWVSDTVFNILTTARTVDDMAAARKGLTTGDNEQFVRLWHEISIVKSTLTSNIGEKWFPMTKGGLFRKWYGNNENVINWEDDGFAIKHFFDEEGKLRSVIRNAQYYLKECISWNDTASCDLAFRYQDKSFIPNASGPCVYRGIVDIVYLLGLFNSKVSRAFMQVLAPALKFEVGQIARYPVLYDRNRENTINRLVNDCIMISKCDWDSFETSWDFKRHPLI